MSEPSPVIEPTRRQWVGFWSMIIQQTQNAFNDKAAQFILIPLGGAVAFSVESWAGLMIALPFVLFAPLAGWLSDRYSKRDVMVGAAACQVLILSWIAAAVWVRNMPMALAGFFALAVQSAFFSPAKIGINKELVGSKHLGFAAGIQQMLAMLAILAGQIAAGWIYDKRYTAMGGTPEVAWQAAFLPLVLLAGLSVPALVMAWIIPRVPAQGGEKLTPGVLVQHFKHLKELWHDPGLRRGAIGVAFFWGFAAYINLWSLKVAKELTGGGGGFGTLSSIFMAAASLGMIGGFGVASFLLRRRIELGWVPLAGVMMTVFAVVLACVKAQPTLRLISAEEFSWLMGLKIASGSLFLWTLGALAFFSALFLAPLNAWMQDNYPAAKRGEMQAAVNLQDCFSGIISVALIEGFVALAASLGVAPLAGYRWQMVVVAAACGVMTWFIIRLLPGDFIRVIGVGVIRSLYRIRVVHPGRVPVTGGALLLPNHVTFADAFFISAASPRPVRFVMDEAFTAKSSIRAFTNIFNTVTIRRDQPREAIVKTIEALRQGDLVCLFPEGQLTRTGALCELKRGFELIARKAGHPLIPMWNDGAWGSIFSFERGRFFRKRPYQIPYDLTLAFGRVLAPESASAEAVRHGIFRASAEAQARRFHAAGWRRRLPRGGHPAADAFRLMEDEDRKRFWINGYQIGQVNALKRRQPFGALGSDPLVTKLPGLFAAFPELFKSPASLHGDFRAEGVSQWVGGDALRGWLESANPSREIVFYDFSESAAVPLDRPGVVHCPCLAVRGIVIAMSMPDPPKAFSTSEFQAGRKPGALGKLLPGWYLKESDGRLIAKGPAAPMEGLPLPEGLHLDSEGFLISRELAR